MATALLATMPFALDATCPGCKVMLQVAHVDEGEVIGVYSEARYLLARGSAP